MIDVEKIDVDFDAGRLLNLTVPLLGVKGDSTKTRLDYVRLYHPVIKLVTDKKGDLNIDEFIRRINKLTASPTPKKKSTPTPFIISDAEIVDGRYTGRVAGQPNTREGKYERLVGWLAARGRTIAEFRESWFYADSLNDLPLLSRVTHPVVVNADPVLAAHGRHMGWREQRIA